MSIRAGPINIIGGGLAGSLLALLLARRGFVVTVFERRADPRLAAQDGGRSINLALASRGIAALTRAGIERQVDPLLIAMRGRMIHEHAGDCALQLYGQTPREVIYSVSRSALNRVLLAAADAHPNVTLRFGHSCLGAHPGYRSMHMRDEAAEHAYELPLGPTFATDGAGSAVRASLIAAGATDGREQLLEHDYKELTIPAPAANSTLARDALHIWPRGDFMLIALPNTDGSFTATLFLPRSGPNSFATLPTHAAVQSFFAREFPATVGLIPDLAQQFFAHPQGIMGTVYCDRWHAGGDLLMLGDAAHAIVPFHGQGMNCAFEDCGELDRLLDSHDSWATLFADFQHLRKPNTDAIAAMALENYLEMRAAVLDPAYLRRKALATTLEKSYPMRFIPRYSMVMFHPEIGYAQARRRGQIQQQLLIELEQTGLDPSSDKARALIEAQLARDG